MHPVTSLGEQGLLLRAALRRCGRRAKPAPVHELRTATRRIEAVLELLPLVGLRQGGREQEGFLRAARRIRRAAGETRDLDVQLELLAALPAQVRGERIGAERRRLAGKIAARRERRAGELTLLIDARGEKLLRALERLRTSLAPALETSVANTRLLEVAERTFRSGRARSGALEGAEALHGLRKAAKLARYMAEMGAADPAARARAQGFQGLQQKIGEWHDALLLAEFAGRHLKAGSALLGALEERQRRTHGAALRRAERFV